MKFFGIFTLLLAFLMASLSSARLTLLRLSHGDQKLRGLSTRQEPSAYEAHLAFRELISFWGEMSTSMSAPPAPPSLPSPVNIPGLDWDIFSMSMSIPTMPAGGSSMSMPSGITLGDTVYDPVVPVNVDDTSGSVESTVTEGDGSVANGDADTDSAAADNLENDSNASTSSGASTPQTVLFIALVGAAMAVMSAWYVRKNQRAASSNASQMTPASSPLL